MLQYCKKNVVKYNETLFSFLYQIYILPLHQKKKKIKHKKYEEIFHRIISFYVNKFYDANNVC